MKSSEQFAIEWNLSKRTINDLCNKGKIPGAIKEGRKWLIPDDAVRPVDKRVSSGSTQRRRLRIISHYLLVFLIMSEHRQIITM